MLSHMNLEHGCAVSLVLWCQIFCLSTRTHQSQQSSHGRVITVLSNMYPNKYHRPNHHQLYHKPAAQASDKFQVVVRLCIGTRCVVKSQLDLKVKAVADRTPFAFAWPANMSVSLINIRSSPWHCLQILEVCIIWIVCRMAIDGLSRWPSNSLFECCTDTQLENQHQCIRLELLLFLATEMWRDKNCATVISALLWMARRAALDPPSILSLAWQREVPGMAARRVKAAIMWTQHGILSNVYAS